VFLGDASYVATPDGHMEAFSNGTGKRLWSIQLPGPPWPIILTYTA
jgi:hypothetical protein